MAIGLFEGAMSSFRDGSNAQIEAITTPADGRVGCEADIRTGLPHVGAHRSRDGGKFHTRGAVISNIF